MMTNNTVKFSMIGVDASRLQLDIAIDGKQATTVSNEVVGYQELLEHLVDPVKVCFVMEAAGGYGRSFAHYPLAQGIAVIIVNTHGAQVPNGSGITQKPLVPLGYRPVCQK